MFWRRRKSRAPGILLAKFEGALPQHHNYWPLADGFSADAAANPETRKVLRERCRSEAENNPLFDGLLETLAQDLIGSGPLLQLLLEDDEAANDQVESAWQEWAEAVDLADKLRIMRRARGTDGEIFAVFTSNPKINHAVKLDIKLIEADQVTSPRPYDFDQAGIDGIEFDEHGNPSKYLILKNHPGDTHQPFHGTIEYDAVDAERVVHYFKAKRAGQSRGLPDFAPAMLRFAQYNRFILATLNAAETAASFAGVIQSTAPANEEAPDTALKGGEDILINRGTFGVLPHQWAMAQLKAEHPNTNFQMFRREIVGDCARCVNMPVNIAILHSGGMNFASGRLDDRIYNTSLRLERTHLESRVVERILAEFLKEAVLVSDVLPLKVRTMVAKEEPLPHEWNWPGRDYAVDPHTEAVAATERVNSLQSSHSIEQGKLGRDWRETFRQIAAERELIVELDPEGKLGMNTWAIAAAAEEQTAANGKGQEADDE